MSKELFKALSDFQNECPIIYKGTKGYGYQYADLTAIIPVINPLLKKHKLSYAQPLKGNSIETIIFHIESGESISSIIDIPQGVQLKGMNDFQVLGSAITYLRRYSLASILGLITDADLDACGVQESKQENVSAPKIQEVPQDLQNKIISLIADCDTLDKLTSLANTSDGKKALNYPSLKALFTGKRIELEKNGK